MIHTQQNQESTINKPKNFVVNETNYKFVENLNKSNQNNNERTVTQSGVLNTQINNSIMNTQQNQVTKNDIGKKLNISANQGL